MGAWLSAYMSTVHKSNMHGAGASNLNHTHSIISDIVTHFTKGKLSWANLISRPHVCWMWTIVQHVLNCWLFVPCTRYYCWTNKNSKIQLYTFSIIWNYDVLQTHTCSWAAVGWVSGQSRPIKCTKCNLVGTIFGTHCPLTLAQLRIGSWHKKWSTGQANQLKATMQMQLLPPNLIVYFVADKCSLCVKGYLAARQYMDGIISTVLLMVDSGLPCFSRGDPIGNLRKRFHPEMSEREAANFMIYTCTDAYNKWTTAGYDLIQYIQQGIEKWCLMGPDRRKHGPVHHSPLLHRSPW